MKRHISFTCGLALLAVAPLSRTNADFAPISLTPETFTADIVVEKEADHPFSPGSTASMDAGTANTGFTYYEQGYNIDAPWSGLPVAGSVITSETLPDHSFALPASYEQPNALLINNTLSNGTFTVTTPTAVSSLSFLGAAGHGPVTLNYTLRFSNGQTETGSFDFADWFGGENTAITANGRVTPTTGGFDNVDSGNPRVYSVDIPVSNTATPVASIDLSFGTGAGDAHAVIFAVSASTGAEFSPLNVTGFNQDLVVEAGATHPGPVNATTASMDGGIANTGATWYEQGYNTAEPTTGLPAAGSTLTNVSAADHIFELPETYAANNAVIVDAANTTAELTFVTPASYSALSLLGSSGNGAVTIDYVVNHTDGNTQTGTIVVPDWFNVNPFAFTTRGRVNVETALFSAMNTDNPRLYSIDIAIERTTSPISSVVLNYSTGNGHAAILAVSGAGGAVRPIFDTQPAAATVFEGTSLSLETLVSGTEPISYLWQTEVNGTFTDVANTGGISGANTRTLSFANATLAQSGIYRLVASNVAGISTSLVAQVKVLSSKTDVTSPFDTITAVDGSSPANEPVENAIDDTTTKYLNFGFEPTAAPFVGPVGLTVTPAAGITTVTGLRIYTANDAVPRDPADFLLEGSNDGTTFVRIAGGPLALPDARNGAGAELDPLTQALQEVNFPNSAGYTTYRLTFANVKDNAAANSVQIAEIELLGTVGGSTQPQVQITRAENNSVTLSWTGSGRLEATTALGGTWTEVPGSSPVTVPATAAAQFFRVVE